MNQTINRKDNFVDKGAYILIDYKDYDATILSSGSEVEIALGIIKIKMITI